MSVCGSLGVCVCVRVCAQNTRVRNEQIESEQQEYEV